MSTVTVTRYVHHASRKDPKKAFDQAIAEGRLSREPMASNYERLNKIN